MFLRILILECILAPALPSTVSPDRVLSGGGEDTAKQISPLSYSQLYQAYLDLGNAVTLAVYSLVLGSLTWVTIEIVTNPHLLCTTIFVTC